jgi:hypothetical protein
MANRPNIEAMAELEAKATPGPWDAKPIEVEGVGAGWWLETPAPASPVKADTDFVSAARDFIRDAIAYIRELEARPSWTEGFNAGRMQERGEVVMALREWAKDAKRTAQEVPMGEVEAFERCAERASAFGFAANEIMNAEHRKHAEPSK